MKNSSEISHKNKIKKLGSLPNKQILSERKNDSIKFRIKKSKSIEENLYDEKTTKIQKIDENYILNIESKLLNDFIKKSIKKRIVSSSPINRSDKKTEKLSNKKLHIKTIENELNTKCN